MALFGGIGKKLGLGSARDVFGEGIGGLVEDIGDTINEALPTVGAAIGYAYGGPAFEALGSGLGTAAQGGRSTKDILLNSALAFGAAKVAPSFGINPQENFGGEGIGSLLPDVSGFKLNPFSDESMLADAGIGSETPVTDLTKTDGGGIASLLKGASLGDIALAGSLGLGALGLLGGEPEPDDRPDRPYPKGEAFGTVQDRDGKFYEIADPEQMREYNRKMREYQDPKFRYDTDDIVVTAKDGGSFDDFIEGEVKGPGTGTSDSVPARLSDGEFVLTAKSVRGAGGGDRDIGAARLYDMMADLEATA